MCVRATIIDFTAGKVIYQNYPTMLDTVCINNKAAQPSINSADLLSLSLRLHIHSLIYGSVIYFVSTTLVPSLFQGTHPFAPAGLQ